MNKDVAPVLELLTDQGERVNINRIRHYEVLWENLGRLTQPGGFREGFLEEGLPKSSPEGQMRVSQAGIGGMLYGKGTPPGLPAALLRGEWLCDLLRWMQHPQERAPNLLSLCQAGEMARLLLNEGLFRANVSA